MVIHQEYHCLIRKVLLTGNNNNDNTNTFRFLGGCSLSSKSLDGGLNGVPIYGINGISPCLIRKVLLTVNTCVIIMIILIP